MFKRIAVIAFSIIAVILIFAAMRPDDFRVERSIIVNAPPEKIFPLINDLKGFTQWSPYEGRDPAMKKTFGSHTAGHGGSYAWNGNDDVGSGRLEITHSEAPRQVTMQLDFDRPIEAHNVVSFHLSPQGQGTRVTWAMAGPMPYMSKVIGLFFDMDSMVGTDFEKGLANLKALAEK